MKYGSVCSGIEAASVAWHPLGWKAAWFSEIEPFPAAVLKERFPEVPNLGDMTKLEEHEVFKQEKIDLLVGGTPCQAFSVAGLRKSLEDDRGNLSLTFCQIAHTAAPRWVVWENVPGVLNTRDNAFGCFLAGLVGSSDPLVPDGGKWARAGVVSGPRYGLAWRVLDAQHFGVPQRRRRVFVVGYLGDWRPAAKVLFESAGLRGDSQEGREAGEGLARDVERSLTTGGNRQDGTADTYAIQERAVSENTQNGPGGKGFQKNKACTLEARPHVQAVAHTLKGEGHDASEDGTGRGVPLVPQNSRSEVREMGDKTGAVTSEPGAQCQNYLAFTQGQLARGEGGQGPSDKHFGSLRADAGDQAPCVARGMSVRRLTPIETERLQGFPDDWTRIPKRLYKRRRITKNRPADMWEKVKGGWMLMAADGPRYKAVGNSMAVPCMAWIGSRIAEERAALRAMEII